MIKRKEIELVNEGKEHTIVFAYCAPGKYRVSNIPILAKKNAIVEFSVPFWLQESTVSLELYEFVYNKPYFENEEHKKEEKIFPWYGMSFEEVEDFLERLNRIAFVNDTEIVFDLPSNSEWEHGLLCGKDETWSWGHDDGNLEKYAWYQDNSKNKVHPVMQKKPNAWGLYDMYGNVYEYCYESLSDTEKSYFLNPSIIYPSKEGVLSCLGGCYKSSIENCHSFKVVDYFNEYIEPTGFRLIIR